MGRVASGGQDDVNRQERWAWGREDIFSVRIEQ